MLQLMGLSDEEINRLCEQPQIHREDIFGKAIACMQGNKERLRAKHPGKHIHVNARSLDYSIGDTHDDAVNQHYGPVGRDGRDFVSVWLKPRG